ncbi:WhiB family transcriptional regulator [Streptomonospora nanhaiensis]|uniref:WhiB family transcriptional regulator n=1 Tax=Streptomonospora nanhaiensis TaxID=1323731 RepID=UPI0027E2B107|nr:WhiB family transcriptional regulator [Streptomonospora nanhaiensis]
MSPTITIARPVTRADITASWRLDAACDGEDTNLFYAPDREKAARRDAREAKAKTICGYCPVRTQCLDDAVATNDVHGIRGGLTAEELKAERRRRMRRGDLSPAPRRPDVCGNGHAYTPANTRFEKGGRRCRTCATERDRKRRAAA